MEPLVEFKDIYASYDRETVLNGISFKIFKGDKIALVGNNGAGKTTIIHILCNVHPYNHGSYLFDGKEINPNTVEYKKKLGVILSKPFYIEQFTMREYLFFVAKMYGVSQKKINKRLIKWTKRFNIDQLLNDRICNLSSGEKMKVSVLASILHDPILLVYDEPFTYLDFTSIDILKGSILNTKGKTVFLASNNLNECLDICNKFLIIQNGKVEYCFEKENHDLRSIQDKMEDVLNSN